MRIDITGLTSEFQGVGRDDTGRAVFVPGALAGETAEAHIVKAEKRFARAALDRVLTPSPERRAPFCPRYGACGGCHAQHMSYEAALDAKRQVVQNALERLGGFDAPEVRKTLPCERNTRYRNKAEYTLGSAGPGFLGASSKRFVPVEDCPIQNPAANQAARAVAAWKNARGADMRQAVTRVNGKGEVMLTVTGFSPDPWPGFAEAMRAAIPNLISIHRVRLNANPAHALDGNVAKIWGADALTETLLGASYALSPLSFFQVNTPQAEKLYTEAANALRLTGAESVVDAYCGVGSIALTLAPRALRVTGIECVPEAVADARANAKRNGINNAAFVCADAPARLEEMANADARIDALVADPPRGGLTERFLRAALQCAPARIVYVSCFPGTLARDLKLLAGAYRLEYAQPVDMFPWTEHVETVVLLAREA